MNEVIISLIRTGVMLVIGGLISWAARHGFDFAEHQEEAIVGVTGAGVFVYYAVIRVLEKKWPGFGILLGIPKAPGYDTTAGNVAVAPAPTTDTATPAGAHFANG